jgi:hypothetical protein
MLKLNPHCGGMESFLGGKLLSYEHCALTNRINALIQESSESCLILPTLLPGKNTALVPFYTLNLRFLYLRRTVNIQISVFYITQSMTLSYRSTNKLTLLDLSGPSYIATVFQVSFPLTLKHKSFLIFPYFSWVPS